MKKKSLLITFLIIAIGVNLSFKLQAQDTLQGTIKYQLVKKYDFKKSDNKRWKEHMENLPTEGSFAYVLYYNEQTAIYTENVLEQEELPKELNRALHRQKYGKDPKPELKQVYYDLEKGIKIENIEFMTRDFLLEKELVTPAWKLLPDQRKILDYACMSAEITVGEKVIKAWFTPEIPIAIGPDNYYGLPGIILALEKDGETFLLATSIENKLPEEKVIAKPKDGKKVDQEKLDKIMEEKTKEHNKEMEARRKSRKNGKGHHGKK